MLNWGENTKIVNTQARLVVGAVDFEAMRNARVVYIYLLSVQIGRNVKLTGYSQCYSHSPI